MRRESLHDGVLGAIAVEFGSGLFSTPLLEEFLLFLKEAGTQGSLTPSLYSYKTQMEPFSPIL